jgi:hypothetical protein
MITYKDNYRLLQNGCQVVGINTRYFNFITKDNLVYPINNPEVFLDNGYTDVKTTNVLTGCFTQTEHLKVFISRYECLARIPNWYLVTLFKKHDMFPKLIHKTGFTDDGLVYMVQQCIDRPFSVDEYAFNPKMVEDVDIRLWHWIVSEKDERIRKAYSLGAKDCNIKKESLYSDLRDKYRNFPRIVITEE